jgi:hypothetical protein
VSELDHGISAGDACTRRMLLHRGALATTAAVAAPVGLTAAAPVAEAMAPDVSGDRRIVAWRGLDAWRSEVALIRLGSRGLVAAGTQVGLAPVAYRLDYRLEAADDFVTRRLSLTAEGTGWTRHLDLRRSRAGVWTADASAHGHVDLPAPGGDVATFATAIDCDLGYSPLTNLMPIRRSGLDRHEGAQDFLMAWVSVPDLGVVASAQRYEHVRATGGGSVVRYVDRGLFPGFKADLRLDRTGVIERYPGLAEQVQPKQRHA